jgi:hypothetical protein
MSFGRDWDQVMAQLNAMPSGRLCVLMGSPGSAQVTRVRLLASFTNLKCKTEGSTIVLELTHP